MPTDNRRPLKTRSAAWAQALARRLVRGGVSPNAISLLSIVFAVLGACALICYPGSSVALVAAAACVQLRLLCNMLDGMVAIEGGKQSAVGVLYNEIPDRVADSLFIVALGFAAGAPWLGWLGALAAAVTAYIRVLGGTLRAAAGLSRAAREAAPDVRDDARLPARRRRAARFGQSLLAARSRRRSSRPVRWSRASCARSRSRRSCADARASADEGTPVRPSAATLVAIVKLLVGAYPRWVGCGPDERQRIYFANHTSHVDTLALWAALPRKLRYRTHPVAARDYWGKAGCASTSRRARCAPC